MSSRGKMVNVKIGCRNFDQSVLEENCNKTLESNGRNFQAACSPESVGHKSKSFMH